MPHTRFIACQKFNTGTCQIVGSRLFPLLRLKSKVPIQRSESIRWLDRYVVVCAPQKAALLLKFALMIIDRQSNTVEARVRLPVPAVDELEGIGYC